MSPKDTPVSTIKAVQIAAFSTGEYNEGCNGDSKSLKIFSISSALLMALSFRPAELAILDCLFFFAIL